MSGPRTVLALSAATVGGSSRDSPRGREPAGEAWSYATDVVTDKVLMRLA